MTYNRNRYSFKCFYTIFKQKYFRTSAYLQRTDEGLSFLYASRPIFKACCDQKQSGMAEFLRDAIFIYTGKE
ncbi:TipAS antibiotic-recognition domain-containing protein [Anoxybacillus kestanbolensis]|uniref:TipAS antibiotic-recognition domain-containing protein n=1 Tax=Anoxybacillus kestanbolensis TaxID=227476 RepID=UPI003D197961